MPSLLSEERPSSFFWAALLSIAAMPLLPEYLAPILSVLSCILSWQDCRRSGIPFRIGTSACYILIYVFYTLLGTLYSDVPASCAATAGMWLFMAGMYLALVNLLSTSARWHCLLRLLTVVVGAIGAIACLEYVLNLLWPGCVPKQFWDPLDALVYRLSPIPIRLENEGLRVGSTFSNPNVFAEGMVMLLPFSLFCITTDTTRRDRIIHTVCLSLGVLGTIFSFSRGAFLALFAMAVVSIAFNFGHLLHHRRLLIGLISSILLLLAVLALVPNPLSARMETLNTDDVSIQARLNIWHACSRLFWDTPPQSFSELFTHLNLRHLLFGIGAGTQNSEAVLLQAGIGGAPHMHNLFLQLLTEGGLISLSILGLWMARTAYRQLQLRKKSTEAHFFVGAMLTMLCGSMLFGLVDFLFLCPKLVGIFLLCMALADASLSLYGGNALRPCSLKRIFPSK